jgi:hypothetical protein
MISGDLGYVGKEKLQELREEVWDVERMLKRMIKSLENKHLNPWPRPINLTGLSIKCQHCEAWSNTSSSTIWSDFMSPWGIGPLMRYMSKSE